MDIDNDELEIGQERRALAFRSAPWVYAFGPFRLDPTRGLLTYGNEVVSLPERLITILVTLIRANGMVVAREELHALIWPDGGIGDNNLSQHIYMLRRALGERANDRLYISTVHNKGFRFIAPISVVDPSQPENEPAPRLPNNTDLSGAMLEVFRHYSLGCQLLFRGRAENLFAAAEQFELALKLDAEYAPALMGWARAYLSLARNCYLPGPQAYPKAREGIIRALKIDPMSAPAHAILSNLILCVDWNWGEAKREIDTAVRINADNSVVRMCLVWMYEWSGQFEKGLSEIQSAIAIEPSSPAFQVILGRLLIACEQYDQAISHLTHMLESSPEHAPRARHYRALAYLLAAQPADALADLLLVPHDHAEDLAWRMPLLGQAYIGVGDLEMAEQVYKSLLVAAKTEYVAFTNLAPLALGLGRRNEAIHHLEVATLRREPTLPLLRHMSFLAPLRKSEAFRTLVEAIARKTPADEGEEQARRAV